MLKRKVVKDVMDKKVVQAKDNATIRQVAGLLVSNRLSGFPVTNKKGELAGFISERDIIKALSEGHLANKKTKDIMSKNVISVDENTSLEKASQVFSKYPFRYIPVCRKKKIVGIISRKDVIDKLLGQYY